MLDSTRHKPILLSEPILGSEEKAALCAVIDSGWLTMGDRVAAFEKAFAELHGADAAVAVNSCTAALHLALIALGIGPGDEVLVPSLTFVATANAVLYTGAAPVFVDIESLNSPHISLEDARQKLTPHTRAVVVMHYGGYLVDLVAWRRFADENGLVLIEDAAHAPGMSQVGSISDAAAFSFFSNKNMSTAEGGMVLTRNGEALERIRRMRAHGMTTDTLSRHRGHAYTYDVVALGYNYRMDELRAALGLVQLKSLLIWNEKRNALSNSYRRQIGLLTPTVRLPFASSHPSAAHLMPVLLPVGSDRMAIMEALKNAGVQSSIHYPPVHKFSFYRQANSNCEVSKTEEFCRTELSLPIHPKLTEEDVIDVAMQLAEAVKRFSH
jgi:dTDP-4-amino-4,6-dideoxygalactose transaminase